MFPFTSIEIFTSVEIFWPPAVSNSCVGPWVRVKTSERSSPMLEPLTPDPSPRVRGEGRRDSISESEANHVYLLVGYGARGRQDAMCASLVLFLFAPQP